MLYQDAYHELCLETNVISAYIYYLHDYNLYNIITFVTIVLTVINGTCSDPRTKI